MFAGDDYEKCSISAGVIKGYLNEKHHLPEVNKCTKRNNMSSLILNPRDNLISVSSPDDCADN